MDAAYLYLNAVLYLVFALWCTFTPAKTAMSLGYSALTAGGRSEYLVIYGGLQWGLAIMFWLMARNVEMNRFGMLVSLAIYAPLVAYRWVTVIRFWPVAPLTVATGCLEALLLIAAVALYVAGR